MTELDIDAYVNIFIKIYNYYNEKYLGLDGKEKFKVLYSLMLASRASNKFDDNIFYEVLTKDEIQKMHDVPYDFLVNYLFGCLDYEIQGKIISNERIASYNKQKYEFDIANARLINFYTEFLNIYKELFNELYICSGLDISLLFAELLWRGDFSVSGKHKYRAEINKKEYFLAGSVFNGYGVCHNYSILLRDFLKNGNIDNVVCSGFDIPNPFNIYLHDKFYSIFLNKKSANHAFNIIDENNEQYIFDATNKEVLNIGENLVATAYDDSYKILLKKDLLYFLNNGNASIDLLQDVRYGNIKSQLSYSYIESEKEKIEYILGHNESLINEAFGLAHEPILEICKIYNKL